MKASFPTLLILSLLFLYGCGDYKIVNTKSLDYESRYIDMGDTIKDAYTGLIWSKCDYGQTWSGERCDGKAIKVTWYDAQKVVRSKTQWSVPHYSELLSLTFCHYPRSYTFPYPRAYGTTDYGPHELCRNTEDLTVSRTFSSISSDIDGYWTNTFSNKQWTPYGGTNQDTTRKHLCIDFNPFKNCEPSTVTLYHRGGPQDMQVDKTLKRHLRLVRFDSTNR